MLSLRSFLSTAFLPLFLFAVASCVCMEVCVHSWCGEGVGSFKGI